MILRHAPEKIDIELNTEGFADVEELLLKMNSKGEQIDFKTLESIVNTNAKKRFAFNSDKSMIRAKQGHSIKIDHGFKSTVPPEILYHGTGQKSVASILKNGIDKRNRHHVHLSFDIDTAKKVGQRHGKPIILEIKALKMNRNGHEFYLSDNNVWLTEFVPIEYINKNKNDG
jgi:putative RNA 2'-phosphotransferase